MKKKAKQVEDTSLWLEQPQKNSISEHSNLKNISQKDLEKHYDVKLTEEEFKVIRDLAVEDIEIDIGKVSPFLRAYPIYPFDQYMLSVKQWGTKSGKTRKNPKYREYGSLKSSVGGRGGSFGIETPARLHDFKDRSLQETYVSIQEKIDDRYPKSEKKRKAIREQNKQTLKENKKNYSTSVGFDPEVIIGFVILIFLTWLIFGVILGGGDLSPGGPKFFGDDGG